MITRLQLDLSGFGIDLTTADGALAEDVARRWSGFARAPGSPAALHVEVEDVPAALPEGAFGDKSIVVRRVGGAFEIRMPEGCARVGCDGQIRIGVPRGTVEERAFAVDNVLLAALALALPERGACLLHAAAAVIGGEAVIFLGGEGAGKSTWAGHAAARGAVVLSDDLVFVAAGGGAVLALASPFRAERNPGARSTSFPVRAVLVPERARAHALDRLGVLRSVAAVTAGLMYECAGTSRAARETAEAVARAVPVLRFRFAPDPGWIDLLRRARI